MGAPLQCHRCPLRGRVESWTRHTPGCPAAIRPRGSRRCIPTAPEEEEEEEEDDDDDDGDKKKKG